MSLARQQFQNPFRVLSPEEMAAEDVCDLFVEPFTDFSKITLPGHAMLNGPRGSGKSMIFRYLLPDCQRIQIGASFSDLPFFAFLISIKNAGPTTNLTEFRRLSEHADIVFNEHVLTVFIASKVFRYMQQLNFKDSSQEQQESIEYFDTVFSRHLALCGKRCEAPSSFENQVSPSAIFGHIADVCEGTFAEFIQYTKRIATDQFPSYAGALCGYTDFLFPVLAGLQKLSFLPNRPLYILIDDADYLSLTQTVILNSWISSRTHTTVSFKVSTQLLYKTSATMSGLPIQPPHDYQEINIADIHTSRYKRYRQRVEQIVRKRLDRWSKDMDLDRDVSPSNFFPDDVAQEQQIRDIAGSIRRKFDSSGRGSRVSDDVARYARPEFIKSLGGQSKSTSTYSYAGFAQLVHISSGLVRYFLESASQMFADEQSRVDPAGITSIRPSIQNEVVRDQANQLMFEHFDHVEVGVDVDRLDGVRDSVAIDSTHRDMQRLRNLIMGLGGLFFLKLISSDAERRVFSVALSGHPTPYIVRTFELGVQCGYFHRSSIGNKDGTGRTRLYVLTRRIAPYFGLDPSSFAGYLWVTSEFVAQLIQDPQAVLRKLKSSGSLADLEVDQLSLFDEEE